MAQELEQRGRLVYTNVGVSMMPLLRQGRDLMIIQKRGPQRLKKYDAALYLRGDGRLILHRVLKVREHDYVIVGDNCRQKEYVAEEQILGILTEVVRDGKRFPVTDRKYLLYVHLWCDFFPIRAGLIWMREKYHRLRHRVAVLLGIHKK